MSYVADNRKSVLIIQGQMKHYRVPFFTRLRDVLRNSGIDLRVAYGEAPEHADRNDQAELPPDLGLRVNTYPVFSNRILYQPLLRAVASVDLIVAEQTNKFVLNYLLVTLSVLKCKRVAFWGLGESKNEGRSEFSEWTRRRIANKVDWWFAYTPGTKAYLVANGVSKERVTVVFNAVDTHDLSQQIASISDGEVASARLALKIGEGDPIGLFVGALLPDKGLGLLLESAKLIKVKIPGFHLVIVGGGPEQETVREATRVFPWIHWVGPKFGREKAILFKMAATLLLPGRVGLVILEAFAAGLPLITVDVPYHGNEVEYLADGKNGLVTKNNAEAYASSVISFFSNAALQRDLTQSALASGGKYSLDAMVVNFRDGVLACLA